MKKVKLLKQGVFTADLAVRIGKSERTIWRWIEDQGWKAHYMTAPSGQPRRAVTKAHALKLGEIAGAK